MNQIINLKVIEGEYMDFPDLETDRLYLIQLSEPHVDGFFDILSRDNVTKYYGTDPLNSRDEAPRNHPHVSRSI